VDACVLVSKGKLPVYLSGDRLRELYQRYFGGKPTDTLWFDSKNSSNVTCQAMLDLTTKPAAGVFVAPSEKAYFLLKPLCTPGMIPFQLITLNGNFFQVCFDHGVPLLAKDGNDICFSAHAEGTSLYEARDMALGVIEDQDIHRYIYNEKYGDVSAALVKEYSGTSQGVGNTVRHEATGATGPSTPPLYRAPCSDKCILSDPNITVKCHCFAYAGRNLGYNSRDHYLESLIALSSLDEVKFIKAVASTVFSQRGAKFVDLVSNVPNPHSSEQYLQAYELLKSCVFQEDCSIHNALVGGDLLLMKVFLGFVKL